MFYEEELEDSPHCPRCLGLGGFLGQLGRLIWFRCIQCGMDFSQEEIR